MRRPIIAVAVAVLILAAATAAGLGISACGSSTTTATTQAAAGGAPAGGQAPDMSAAFTTALDPLVKAGTITSDQESAVIDSLTSSMPGGQGGQAPGSGSTPPSGSMPSPGATPQGGGSQGTMPDPSQMFSSALDKLVSGGTITSAQETAISKALSSAMQGGPGQQGGTKTQAGSSSST